LDRIESGLEKVKKGLEALEEKSTGMENKGMAEMIEETIQRLRV